MNESPQLAAVRAALAEIAPEVDLDTVDPDAPLQETLELDSVDFLSFVEQLHSRLGVDVPERDYPLLSTLAATVAYLERHRS